jgi:hypothetical protein
LYRDNQNFQKPEPESIDISMLQGKWQWIKSIGGIGGHRLTPESVGYNKIIELKSLRYYEYVDDSLINDSRFMYCEQLNSLRHVLLIPIGNSIRTYGFGRTSDTLYLWDAGIVCGGFRHTYVRVQQ